MKKMIVSVLAFVCILFMFPPFLCAERPIRILFVEALSGPPKSIGERHVLGCEFAVEEINAQGGLLGRKVEVIAEDNQFKPDVAIAKAQKYLMKLRDQFGDMERAVAAYNYGPGNLSKLLKSNPNDWRQQLPKETQREIQVVVYNNTGGNAATSINQVAK